MIAVTVLASSLAAACGGGSAAVSPSAAPTEHSVATSSAVAPPSAADTTPPVSAPTPEPAPQRPRIVQQPIPYPASRKAQIAAYARRHYGVATWRLAPRAVVLHFTASGAGSEPGVHALFAANQPNRGELPGVCAHFVVDQDGTIYQQVPLNVMCRHTIGLNDRALGIEMVQETGVGAHWADQQILHRPAQRRSVVRLLRWLLWRYRIPVGNVIGHAMANDSPLFRDREGWANDHTDWQAADVAELRRLLR
jgi:N-acetylmuramoyl-L-alanine amidase-like protein